MIENIFDLDFSRWNDILLSLLPALINAGIFIYITFFLPQNRTNSTFSIFVLLVGLWQTAEGFTRMSVTAEAAFEWNKISEVVLLLVIPFGILFMLHFSQWHKKILNNLVFPLLFLPAITLLFFTVARLDQFTMVQSEQWHWIANPEPTFITSLIYIWIAVGALLMLALPWLFYATAKKDDLKRKQSLLLALGFTLPVIIGIIVEIIFPLAFGLDDVPVAATLVTVFSITALVAITKYKLLAFSPMQAFPDILGNMNEGILIVDNEDVIHYANNKFCSMFGYAETEVLGKKAAGIFVSDEHKNIVEEKIKLRKANIADKYELSMLTQSGKKIWCEISGSPYLDAHEKVIGSIGIFTDITDQKRNMSKLSDAQARFLNVLQTSQDAVVLSDAGEKIVFWNKTAEKLFGYTYEEVAEHSIVMLMPERFREENKNTLDKRKNGESGTLNKTVEYIALRKDGTEFPIEHSLGKWEEEGQVFYSRIIRDITHRKRAEEAQSLFRTLIDHSSDCIEVIDPATGRFLDGNEKAWSALGYTREEFLTLSVFDIDPMVNKSAFASISLLLRQSDAQLWEGIHTRKNGTTFPVEVNIKLIRLDREYIVTIVRDITERKKMLSALHESEKKYREFTESSMDAIYAARADDKRIFYANPVFCKLLGYSQQETLQLTLYDIVAHSKEDIDKAIDRFMADNQTALGERIWKKKNGELIYVDVNAVKIKQDGRDIIYIEARDLSEKKLAEKKLQRTLKDLKDYKFALDQPAIVAITDLKGTIKHVNDNFCSISKYSREELIGQNHRIVKSGYHSKEFFKEMWATIASGKIWKGEIKNKAKDGEYYWLDTLIIPFLNEQQKPYQYLSFRMDITARKLAEEKLKQSEEMIRNYAAHLNHVLEEERAFIAKEIHDEIGQLLTGIKLGLASLKKKMEAPPQPSPTPSLPIGEGENNTSPSLGEGFRMGLEGALAGRITDLMQDVDNSMQRFRKISTQLRPAILDTLGLIPSIKFLADEFENKTGIKVKYKAPLNPPIGGKNISSPNGGGQADDSISPDRSVREGAKDLEGALATCFFRICQESLTNISKHAEASEVVIVISYSDSKGDVIPNPASGEESPHKISAHHKEISPPMNRGRNDNLPAQAGEQLTMCISDNGKGIASEKLENPFSMGLLGMRERARSIGGNLEITSELNKGTTIKLRAGI